MRSSCARRLQLELLESYFGQRVRTSILTVCMGLRVHEAWRWVGFCLAQIQGKNLWGFRGRLWSLAHVIDVNADEKFATFLHRYWMRLNDWTGPSKPESSFSAFLASSLGKNHPRTKNLDKPDQGILVLEKNGTKYCSSVFRSSDWSDVTVHAYTSSWDAQHSELISFWRRLHLRAAIFVYSLCSLRADS